MRYQDSLTPILIPYNSHVRETNFISYLSESHYLQSITLKITTKQKAEDKARQSNYW